MTRSKSRPLLTSTLIFLMFGIAACQRSAAVDTGSVEHIENGLLPATSIQGIPAPPPMKLAERMAYYRPHDDSLPSGHRAVYTLRPRRTDASSQS